MQYLHAADWQRPQVTSLSISFTKDENLQEREETEASNIEDGGDPNGPG